MSDVIETTESLVDLTYRGLAVAKRVKLTQVRPSTGYVEVPAPMRAVTDWTTTGVLT